MTEFVDVPGGRLGYEVTGSGPLVVLSHGIGVGRQDYRFLAPMLAQAGYRVASADLRGHGESSMGWPSITRTDIAGDLAALTGHLGGLLRVRRYRRCFFLLGGTPVFRSLGLWLRYLNLAYPAKPADYPGYMTALAAGLREPGRMAEFMKTFKSTPADAEAQLPNVRGPALVIMGTLDPISPTPGRRATRSRRPCPPDWARSRRLTARGTIRTRSRRRRSPRWSSPSSSTTPAPKLEPSAST